MQEKDEKAIELEKIPILNINSEIEKYLREEKAKNIQPKLK